MILNIYYIYILIIVAVIVGFTGLILFVLGLVQAKKVMWGFGLISMVLAFFIAYLTIHSAINKYSRRFSQHKQQEYPNQWGEDQYFYNDSTGETEYFPDSIYSNVISGYLKNRKMDLVFMKLLVNNELENMGIHVSKITQPNSTFENEFYSVVSLYLSFSESFWGLLELKSYDEKRYELSSSIIEVSQSRGMDLYVDFNLENNVKLKDIDYLTLSVAEKEEL